MTNVNLEPGVGSLDALMADTNGGFLMDTNKSWSIDDHRLNFQFGTEVAWKIEGGRKGLMYKNPLYTGSTPVFWGSCDAICGKEDWHVWGLLHVPADHTRARPHLYRHDAVLALAASALLQDRKAGGSEVRDDD
jgi:predicted Zn-dependent protease